MPVVIKVENLSKQYRLGLVGSSTLKDDIHKWWAEARGKENPLLKVGETNNRAEKGDSDYVWSLKNLNFEVEKGDVLGIIGKNGAGKSTLLKILSRVTAPTTGTIKSKGRIASLLEVGTGFHPELTGKENIYLNGAILGMKKAEINEKLDEIINFAGIERYIDTPVKRYSSGMYVRLAFAVAAHLESEILIVDEVLAVGDADFQKKCLGKIKDISSGEGRTVLFVSHNMAAVQSLCNKSILLENGQLTFQGKTADCLDVYVNRNQDFEKKDIENSLNREGNGKVKFCDFYIENEKGEGINKIIGGKTVYLVFKVKVHDNVDKIDIGFSLHNLYDDTLSYLYSGFQNVLFKGKKGEELIIKFCLSNFPFNQSKIKVKGRVMADGHQADWFKDPLAVIDIEKGDFFNTGVTPKNEVPFLIKGEWKNFEYLKKD
jgi:lipopolysaccharide transport system ATP-binding protein